MKTTQLGNYIQTSLFESSLIEPIKRELSFYEQFLNPDRLEGLKVYETNKEHLDGIKKYQKIISELNAKLEKCGYRKNAKLTQGDKYCLVLGNSTLFDEYCRRYSERKLQSLNHECRINGKVVGIHTFNNATRGIASQIYDEFINFKTNGGN